MNNTVIITGGAQRLGLAIAEKLNADGYNVIITYRTPREDLKRIQNSGINTVQADFSTNHGVLHFINWAKSNVGGLRAIIHNASDWAAESAKSDPAEIFTKMMQIHANAPYQINLALSELLTKTDQVTDIIHMTDYVQDKGSKKHIAYAASKAALHNLTLSFSALLAPTVKVNSIAPALVMFNQDDSDEYKQKALKKSLLETCPGAKEAVATVDYLLQSDYITGRTIHLDGGRHLK